MSKFAFIFQYLAKPRTVGAVLPSSKYLANKMTCNINFSQANCIVEFGPGTGVFTKELLKKRRPDTILLLFENNTDFCHMLKEQFAQEKNLHIINDSAEKIGQYLSQHNIQQADYVVSGLPFASLPKDVSVNILTKTKEHLNPNGYFITFQYTLLKKAFIDQFFKDIKITREILNIPPAYVFSCKN